MEPYLLIAILALSKYAADLEKSISQTDSQNINVLTAMNVRLKEADDTLKYFQNLYIYGESEKDVTAQEIEGSCDGCMHIDCERDERPCSECCRLDRVDRYEQEDETLADVFPELHSGKDADHET